MARPPSASTLLRLIEAGQLARRALLAPLAARGLEPGDDAILLALSEPAGATLSELSEATGLDSARLDAMLRRIEDRELLLRLAVGPEMLPGARLSRQGHAVREALEVYWQALEEEIAQAMGRKPRKHLRKGLKSLIALLTS